MSVPLTLADIAIGRRYLHAGCIVEVIAIESHPRHPRYRNGPWHQRKVRVRMIDPPDSNGWALTMIEPWRLTELPAEK